MYIKEKVEVIFKEVQSLQFTFLHLGGPDSYSTKVSFGIAKVGYI